MMSNGRFFADTRGATAVEYGLIAALITVAILGALVSTGGNTGNKWNDVSDKITTATTP